MPPSRPGASNAKPKADTKPKAPSSAHKVPTIVKAPQNISAFKQRKMWDSKFTSKKRTAVAVLGRLNNDREETHTATFRMITDAGPRDHFADTVTRPLTVTIRFPVTQSLAATQLEVARNFRWPASSAIYLQDSHGWDRPLLTDASLQAAFDNWEATSGERNRAKYNALLSEVEDYLGASALEIQLRGAGAAWEIACRNSNHSALSVDFVDSLHGLLSAPFAPATHAAAAIHMLIQVPTTLARFPRRLIDSLDRAVHVALTPPPVDDLASLCRGSPAFLARQPVACLHRLLDTTLPAVQHATLMARSHTDLTLWLLLLRVAPRDEVPETAPNADEPNEPPSNEEEAQEDAAAAAAAAAAKAAAAAVPPPEPLCEVSPAAARAALASASGGGRTRTASILSATETSKVALAEAALVEPPVYALEEVGLRLGVLELLAALIALQPTTCGGRLAAAGALPHLSRWLRRSLDDYLKGDEGGAPAPVVEAAAALAAAAEDTRGKAKAKPTEDDEKAADPKAKAAAAAAAAAAATAAEAQASGMTELQLIDAKRKRSASGSPPALLLLSVASVLLRLRVGRDHTSEAVAVALIETCAAAALPIHQVMASDCMLIAFLISSPSIRCSRHDDP